MAVTWAAGAAEPAPKGVGTQMTKISDVHSIPKPADGKEVEGAIKTKIGSVTEITAFYREWMTAHGWTLDTKNSIMDPNLGVKKGHGFTTIQFWCKRTKPITTVSIITGSGDNTDHGRAADIYIRSLAGEDSCP